MLPLNFLLPFPPPNSLKFDAGASAAIRYKQNYSSVGIIVV